MARERAAGSREPRARSNPCNDVVVRRSVVVAALLALPSSARSDCPMCSPITSRNYAIDLYSGVPLGNSAIIAMGGAAAANATGSSGTLVNPSASGARTTTDLDWWSIDVHLDTLSSSQSTDNWNDGINASNGAGTTELTAGLALRIHDWAGAITGTFQYASFASGAMPGPTFQATTGDVRLAAAKWIPEIDTAIGVAARIAVLSVNQAGAGPGAPSVFSVDGVGAEAGAQWVPYLEDFRVGAAVSTPFAGGNVTTSAACPDPSACMIGGTTYILPNQVYVPWRVTLGGAYRFGPTKWNQLVAGTFRDEREVTLVLDGVATGPAPNSYGLEAFTQNLLQRSGRNVSWSARGGVEWECLPGRLRLRGGSDWEPARFEGVSGRVHGTFGLELRVLEFELWGKRRGRLTATGDLAERYNNFSLSIGFWH
jgi:hypothetical protein